MSITPQQAFEAVRVLRPDVYMILRCVSNTIVISEPNGVNYIWRVANVEWPENVTQWPIPERKWIVPNDEHARSRPVCRVRYRLDQKWLEKQTLVFVKDTKCDEFYKFVAYDKDGYAGRWKYCEIQEEVDTGPIPAGLAGTQRPRVTAGPMSTIGRLKELTP